MRSRFAATLMCHSRPYNLAKAIHIVSIHLKFRFDFPPHIFCPRLRSQNTNTQLYFLSRNTGFLQLFRQVKGKRRSGRHSRTPAITHQLDVLRRIPGRHRNHGSSQMFHSVVQTQTSGEQSVTISHGEYIVTCCAICHKAAGNHLRPNR